MSRHMIFLITEEENLIAKVKKWSNDVDCTLLVFSDPQRMLREFRNRNPELVIIDCGSTNKRHLNISRILEEEKNTFTLKILSSIDKTTLSLLYENLRLKNEIRKLNCDIKNKAIIDKAKRFLMKKWNLEEEVAYGILRKRSMDNCLNIGEVAKDILNRSD